MLKQFGLIQKEHVASPIPAATKFDKHFSQRFVASHQMKLANLAVRQKELSLLQVVEDAFGERCTSC